MTHPLMILRPLGAAIVLLVAVGLLGCGPSLPQTYPVNGKVLIKGTNKPYPGGTITLRLKSDDKVVADGTIEKDGSFTVTTKMYGKERPGAAAGEHTVLVEPAGGVAGPDGQLVIAFDEAEGSLTVEPKENTPTIYVKRTVGK